MRRPRRPLSHLVWGLATTLVCCATAIAQDDDFLIQREIDRALEESVWLAGPFHLRPGFRLSGGYDSDAILTGETSNPDVTISAAPGLRAAVPLGRRALFELYEELGFRYFRELSELRDISTWTRVGGAFGGKQFVARVSDELRAQKIRPTREVDVPVAQQSNLLATAVDLALGSRHQLLFELTRYRVDIRDSDVTVDGVPIENLLDRTEDTFRVTLAQDISPDTRGFVEGFAGRQDFDEATVERDALSYGLAAGFEFTPAGNVRGSARFGYRRIVPDFAQQPDFAGFVGEGDVKVGVGRRYEVQGVYSREPVPSVLSDNLFVVTTELGAFVNIYFGRNYFVRPGIVFGTNGYPARPEEQSDIDTLLVQRFRTWSFSFNRYLTSAWLARAQLSYANRRLNTDSLENRLVVTFEITTGL